MKTQLLAAALFVGALQIASAQEFPVKSIRIVLPYPPRRGYQAPWDNR